MSENKTIIAFKRKGGAERNREKKKQKLQESAKKCKSIIDVFACQHKVSDNKNISENMEHIGNSETLLKNQIAKNPLKYGDSVDYDSSATAFCNSLYLKNRLRSTLTESKLEAFMLMSVEKDTLFNINNDEIIDHLKTKSSLLSKELSY